MDKIDRLGWAAGISFVSYGVRVGVRVSHAGVLDRVRELLPPGWKPTPESQVERMYSVLVAGASARPKRLHKRRIGTRTRRQPHHSPGGPVRRFNLLYGDTQPLSRSRTLEHILHTLESNMRLYVAEEAQRRLFVHAGVVRWRGQAILIPGRTMSGKSTLVAELVKAGATYYSDEYAVCDAQGRVHPYPKPLSLRENGTVSGKPISQEAIGGHPRPGVKPLPTGLIVLTKYRPGARWRPTELSPGMSMLQLLKQTVSARRKPEFSLSTLRQVVSRADALVLNGVRGEAHEMVDALLRRVDERASGVAAEKSPALALAG